VIQEGPQVCKCSSIGFVVEQRIEENVVDRRFRELVSGGKNISGDYETTIMEKGIL